MNIDSLWTKIDPLESNMCQWADFDRETAIRSVKYIVAMHDMGKAHPSFQCKNNKPSPAGYEDEKVLRFRHENISKKI